MRISLSDIQFLDAICWQTGGDGGQPIASIGRCAQFSSTISFDFSAQAMLQMRSARMTKRRPQTWQR